MFSIIGEMKQTKWRRLQRHNQINGDGGNNFAMYNVKQAEIFRNIIGIIWKVKLISLKQAVTTRIVDVSIKTYMSVRGVTNLERTWLRSNW
jgi:hypothetical protein